MRLRFLWSWAGLMAAQLSAAQAFSADEVKRALAYWNEPLRYSVEMPSDFAKNGIYQVRLTVSASTWLWNYNRATGQGKGATAPAAPQPQRQVWEKWIDDKIAFDRFEAQVSAHQLNSQILPGYPKFKMQAVPDPGPAPKSLVDLVGNPPKFAAAVAPLLYRVRFDDAEFAYQDHVAVPAKYAYYRYAQGSRAFGKKVREMPGKELDAIFSAAGVNPSERKIMGAVSLLEGGFDAVNTYDTGYVSIGFIQFASLKEGSGSLGRMLRRYKADFPDQFEADFRRFGLDVTPEALLVALDLDTGAETVGAKANEKIIEDKRLLAVFQRAGQTSLGFRASQVKMAREEYLPTEELISVNANGRTMQFKVRDVIKSEAGLATLMDRKVHTGSIDPLPFVLTLIAAENGIGKPEDLSKFERDIIVAVKHRTDFLADASLTQPGPLAKPGRDYRNLASRKGSRSGRGAARPKP
jgi:hypothetical protein